MLLLPRCGLDGRFGWRLSNPRCAPSLGHPRNLGCNWPAATPLTGSTSEARTSQAQVTGAPRTRIPSWYSNQEPRRQEWAGQDAPHERMMSWWDLNLSSRVYSEARAIARWSSTVAARSCRHGSAATLRRREPAKAPPRESDRRGTIDAWTELGEDEEEASWYVRACVRIMPCFRSSSCGSFPASSRLKHASITWHRSSRCCFHDQWSSNECSQVLDINQVNAVRRDKRPWAQRCFHTTLRLPRKPVRDEAFSE